MSVARDTIELHCKYLLARRSAAITFKLILLQVTFGTPVVDVRWAGGEEDSDKVLLSCLYG